MKDRPPARDSSATRRRVFATPAVMLLVGVAIVGCSQRSPVEEIRLPPTSVLTTGQQWGVVRSEFLRLRADSSLRGEVLAYLRRGEIIEVTGRSAQLQEIEGESEHWYQVSYEGVRGWAFGAYIAVADSRSGAAALLEDPPRTGERRSDE